MNPEGCPPRTVRARSPKHDTRRAGIPKHEIRNSKQVRSSKGRNLKHGSLTLWTIRTPSIRACFGLNLGSFCTISIRLECGGAANWVCFAQNRSGQVAGVTLPAPDPRTPIPGRLALFSTPARPPQTPLPLSSQAFVTRIGPGQLALFRTILVGGLRPPSTHPAGQLALSCTSGSRS